jgi:uncharacterized membrane protein
MIRQPFFIPAIIILVAALPLILALIPPNRVYGVRIPEIMDDPQLWYQVNRYGGWALLVSSLLYLVVAAIFPSVVAGGTLFGRWIVHLGAFAGPLYVSLILIRNQMRQK